MNIRTAMLIAAVFAAAAGCRKGPLKIGPLMIDESPETVAAREEEERSIDCAVLYHRVHSLYRSGEGLRKQNSLIQADDHFHRAILTIETIKARCPAWNVPSLRRLEGLCRDARGWIAQRLEEKDRRAARALGEFTARHAAAPGSAEPYIELGRYYFSEGDYVNAMRQFQEALMKEPSHTGAMIDIARTYTRTGYTDDAKEMYRKALEVNAALPDVHYNLGGIYFREGLPTYAIREYKRALDLDPRYSEAHNALGLVYKQMGRYDQAIRHFKSALRINPEDPHFNYNLGLAFIANNNTQTGLNYLYRAQDLFGRDTPMGRKISERIRRFRRLP